MAQVGVGIIGFGTVGSGTAKNLIEKSKLYRERYGIELGLRAVCDIDLDRPRAFRVDRKLMTTSSASVISDPRIRIVVETVGGTTVAKDIVLEAIAAGKHIVTANKALLATHGREILEAARRAAVLVRFEAAVGGGMPVVEVLTESLRANRIDSITGILNGTSNFVLTRMASEGMDLEHAVKVAQKEGYAELDPSLDLNGTDAAHKISLLSTFAFGQWCDFTKIPIEGITRITPADIAAAERMGHHVKLIAMAHACEEGTRGADVAYDVRVGPMLVPKAYHLGQVDGAFNGIELHGDFVGEVRLFGKGAGMIPTASAVAADVIEIARTITIGAEIVNPGWPDLKKALPLADTSTVERRYSLRVPGVKRGRKKLLVDTLRTCYADAEEVFRLSAEGDFTVAITGEVREVNARRAVQKLREAVDRPEDVYAIPLLSRIL
ncbi:MAG: homoserine dehydrogenase [Verrucomicrobia bacterium]|nr:homoserine dehydrogenase [Verrucomicrobiota bacterium]